MNVWILTTEYNDYDQYGEYFLQAFASKPTPEQLVAEGVPLNRIDRVLNGGGRKSNDHQWWHLVEQELL